MRKSICTLLSLLLGVFVALTFGGGTVSAQGRAQPDTSPAGSSIISPPNAHRFPWRSPFYFLTDIFTRPIQGLPSKGKEFESKQAEITARMEEDYAFRMLLQTAEQQAKYALLHNDKNHFEKWAKFLENVIDRRFRGKDAALNKYSKTAEYYLKSLGGPVFVRNVMKIRDDGTREKDPDANIRLATDQTGTGGGDGGVGEED